MNKRSLLRIATSICFMVSVMFLGQVSAYADEVKPVHEYNFDNDSNGIVYDSGNTKTMINGSAKKDDFVSGYNEKGRARSFTGDSNYFVSFPQGVLPDGPKSIRFKIKKDASSTIQKTEVLISTFNQSTLDFFWIQIVGGNERAGAISVFQSNHSQSLISPTNICDGKWHDILYTWDGTSNSNSAKLYVDDMATPISILRHQSNGEIYNQPLKLGYYAGNTNYNFTGALDNIQIYDSVIAPQLSNLKAIGGDSKVDLTWNAVTDATSYTVKRSTTAGGPYTTIKADVTGTTYTDTDVTNGTTYYYVVTAIVNGSEGWNSNEASATPTATVDPNQPTGNKALLVITMVTGERKEYEMTMDKINNFITWYNSKAASSPTYVIEKDYNKASFTSRKDYILYDQITNFEVSEYND